MQKWVNTCDFIQIIQNSALFHDYFNFKKYMLHHYNMNKQKATYYIEIRKTLLLKASNL